MSRDGIRCAVIVHAGHHRAEASPVDINDIADRLRIPRKDIYEVINDWSPEDLRRHLGKFTAEELKPPARRPYSK